MRSALLGFVGLGVLAGAAGAQREVRSPGFEDAGAAEVPPAWFLPTPSAQGAPVGSAGRDLRATEVLQAFTAACEQVETFSYDVESYGTGRLRDSTPHIRAALHVTPGRGPKEVLWRVDALYLPGTLLPAAHVTLISSPGGCLWLSEEQKQAVQGSIDETYDEWGGLEHHLMVRPLLTRWYAWENQARLDTPIQLHTGESLVGEIACEVIELEHPDSSWVERIAVGLQDHLPRRIEFVDRSTEPPSARVQEISRLRINEPPAPALFEQRVPEGYELRSAAELPQLSYSEAQAGEIRDGPGDAAALQFSQPDAPELERLRGSYPIEELIESCTDDLARARAVCSWVHGRWEHDSSNRPRQADALSILREAEQGGRFRCVEYATVAHACLQALGIPARLVNAMRPDIETRESGCGHLVVEAFLRDRRRWQFMDVQLDVVPTLAGEPLNTVEFQTALVGKHVDLRLREGEGPSYPMWAAECLFYLRYPFDSRVEAGPVANRPQLLLLPDGAAEPRVFERRYPMGSNTATRSLADFYRPATEK